MNSSAPLDLPSRARASVLASRGLGYQHASYAKALSSLGEPRSLHACGGWILVSPIPGHDDKDARGCYPIFCCEDWDRFPEDVEKLTDLVSLVLVADPFGNYTSASLCGCFPDLCMPYKEHYVIDLERRAQEPLPSNHERNVRKALKKVELERCEQPNRFKNEWVDLYSVLVRRHQIKGAAAFSRDSLQAQLEVPGIVAFRAVAQNQTVGMVLWCVNRDAAYYHLAAYDDLGYELGASFALFSASIDYFKDRVRFLSLGAGAGVHSDKPDGLMRFKQGWATGTRTAYLCGRILNRERYDELVKSSGSSGNDYFPLYRKGEIL